MAKIHGGGGDGGCHFNLESSAKMVCLSVKNASNPWYVSDLQGHPISIWRAIASGIDKSNRGQLRTGWRSDFVYHNGRARSECHPAPRFHICLAPCCELSHDDALAFVG